MRPGETTNFSAAAGREAGDCGAGFAAVQVLLGLTGIGPALEIIKGLRCVTTLFENGGIMNAIFRYRQKALPKVVVTLVFGAFGALFYFQNRLTELIITGVIFIVLQGIVHLYFLSKRLVLDNEGITVCLFWRLGIYGAPWKTIEEARFLSGRLLDFQSATAAQRLHGGLTPAGAMRWMFARMNVTLIKFIIQNAEAFIIDLAALKKAADLSDLLKERVRFVELKQPVKPET